MATSTARSKQAFKTWLTERPQPWRDAVEVVAIGGSTGFMAATTKELPDAVAVMDPFHVVRRGRRFGSRRPRVPASSVDLMPASLNESFK